MLGITRFASLLSVQRPIVRSAAVSGAVSHAVRSYSSKVKNNDKTPTNFKNDDSRKTYLINRYKTLLKDTPIVLFAHHNNLVQSDEAAFRALVKEAGGELHMVRNNLLLAYLKAEKEEYPASIDARNRTRKIKHPVAPFLVGPSAMIVIKENNPQIVAKLLKSLKSANEKFFIIGARVESNVFELPELQSFKDLPSKEQLQSQLAGLLTVLSGAGLVQTLQAASTHLYLTLDSHRKNNDPAEKKEEEEKEKEVSS